VSGLFCSDESTWRHMLPALCHCYNKVLYAMFLTALDCTIAYANVELASAVRRE
jgi:hypothetical protein